MPHRDALLVLADPTRRAIFERLREGPTSVGDLAQQVPVSRPAVSQHLKALKLAGLVCEQPQGTRRLYAIRREGLEDLRVWLDTFWAVPFGQQNVATSPLNGGSDPRSAEPV